MGVFKSQKSRNLQVGANIGWAGTLETGSWKGCDWLFVWAENH